jgi:flagellar protein FliS
MNSYDAASAYRESATLGASPVAMVTLLYDRLVQDMYNAISAMNAADVEARTAHLNHALLILQQLQGRLDFQLGGDTARALDTFYSTIRAKLLEGQIRQSRETLSQQIEAVLQVREAWASAEGSSTTVEALAFRRGGLSAP